MPIMNFDLEDGLPPFSFSINGEGAERMMNFMSECQQDRDAHAMQSAEIAELRAKVESLAADAERYRFLRDVCPDDEEPAIMRHVTNDWGNWSYLPLNGEDADQQVDVAMAKEKA